MTPFEDEERRIIRPNGWPEPRGYSDGMIASGRYLTLAGQIGWNPLSGEIETNDFAAQTSLALRNIASLLEAAGAQPSHVVRLTWFITSRDEYMQSRKSIGVAYREVMGTHYPPMSVVIVAGLVEPRAKVEIEATAVLPPLSPP